MSILDSPNLVGFLSLVVTVISAVAAVLGAYYAWVQVQIARQQYGHGVVPLRQYIKELLGVCLATVGILGIFIFLYLREQVSPDRTIVDHSPAPQPRSLDAESVSPDRAIVDYSPAPQPRYKVTIEVLEPVWTGEGRRFNITARVAAVGRAGAVPSGVVTFNIDGHDVPEDVMVQGGEAVLERHVLDRDHNVTIGAVYKPGPEQPFLGARSEPKIFGIN